MYQKSQSHDVWFLRYRVRQTEFFVILGHFLSFYHPSVPLMISKNQNIEKKIKKMSGDIILLYIHVYHKWTSYDIWFLKCKVRQTEIFVILGHFNPLTTQKIKILKLKKAPEDIIILYICTIHGNHMMYVSWDIEHDEQNF